jgi:5S rRNA maturation endonuclease (ribonuclease M5)
MDTRGEKIRRTFKKNVDGRSSCTHDSKKFRKRSMDKQVGMAFGFRKIYR